MALNRRTPLKRKKEWERKPYKWERKTPIAPKSKKQKERDAIYAARRKSYLQVNPWCQICIYLGNAAGRGARRATEIHHARGRNGSLLWDARFFVPSCRGHRLWPHDHPKEARAAGLLASAKDWGVSA